MRREGMCRVARNMKLFTLQTRKRSIFEEIVHHMLKRTPRKRSTFIGFKSVVAEISSTNLAFDSGERFAAPSPPSARLRAAFVVDRNAAI